MERQLIELIDRGWSAILRTGAVYCSIIAIVIAARSQHGTAPVWPLSLYTAIWILALAFPITAALYVMFDLRVRLNQVEDSAQRNGVFTVYFPGFYKSRQGFPTSFEFEVQTILQSLGVELLWSGGGDCGVHGAIFPAQ
jgi:hypothetical protein